MRRVDADLQADVEADVERCLTLLRNKIREKGFIQTQVQEALGWGRTYISQLFRKQKKLKVEQVLLILDVIGVEARDFFAELYLSPRRGPFWARRLTEPSEGRRPEVDELCGLVEVLLEVLLEKRILTRRELQEATERAAATSTP